jgi:hypothetical protein
MDVRINVGDGTDPDATSNLYRWLAADREVRENAQLSWSRTTETGTLGALDVINVVLGNAIALGSLVVSVANWRASRARSPIVRIERDGVPLEVTGGSPEEVEKVVRALLPPPPADGEDA